MTLADNSTATHYAPPYRWSALAAACVLALYLVTLAPTTALWDASEYIAAAKVLGLPHPPGNPLFILMAHAFGMLPIPVSYAARINILAALSSAIATATWFLVIDHVLAHGGLAVRMRRIVAAAGVVLSATAFTVWNQSVVNEKVYTISLAIFAVITWLMIRWADRIDTPRNDAKLVAVAFLLGAGYSVHPAGLLPALAVIVTVIAIRWRKFLNARLWLAVLGAFLIGLTPFVFEPIRAAQHPQMNEGAPTGCTVQLEMSCTFSTTTYTRLADNINRTQYGKPSVLDRQIPFVSQVGMWWMYFEWQWLRDPHGVTPFPQFVLAVVMLALGVYGGVVHWRWDRTSFWYWSAFMFTLTLLLIYYMNFKYGFSQAPELGDAVPREVRDRDYFYLWSYSAWGVWVAIGIAALWRRTSVGASLLALCFIPVLGNWTSASRQGQTIARDWAVDILNSVEPYGVIITAGDNDTFPLWYAQYVEGVRPDVTIVIAGYLGLDWYAPELLHHPPHRYDAATGPSIYRNGTWTAPTHPLFRMTLAQLNAVPDLVELREPQLFRASGVEGRINAGYLGRDEILVLRLITDVLPERPVYFAPGSPYVPRLGLGRYTVHQGLIEKLVPGAPHDSARTMDVERSLALWNIYTGQRAIVKQGDWVDRASLATPLDYSLLGLTLADHLDTMGDTTQARRIQVQALEMIHAARIESVFGLK